MPYLFIRRLNNDETKEAFGCDEFDTNIYSDIDFLNNYIRKSQQQARELEEMKHTPTEQEVCEALSVWDNSVKWEYKPLTDENYECITDGKHHYFINDIDCNEVINCLPCPVYLFALIGRFYEGKVANNE